MSPQINHASPVPGPRGRAMCIPIAPDSGNGLADGHTADYDGKRMQAKTAPSLRWTARLTTTTLVALLAVTTGRAVTDTAGTSTCPLRVGTVSLSVRAFVVCWTFSDLVPVRDEPRVLRRRHDDARRAAATRLAISRPVVTPDACILPHHLDLPPPARA